jgi:hypothetical protein
MLGQIGARRGDGCRAATGAGWKLAGIAPTR